MSKFENKYQNMCKAILKLQELIEQSQLEQDDKFMQEVFRDSLIQRFEFCYEITWKTLREYLVYEGFAEDNSPRSVFKTAYQNNVINNQEVWLAMIRDRNVASHEYNESYIEEVADRIKSSYAAEFTNLIKYLATKK